MQTIRYKPSYQVCYRGCIFDSLTELRFVLSIEQDFHFLRAHIPIRYHFKTLEPTNYLTETTKTYTPDFLMRNKKDKSAYLVEIKPRRLCCSEQLFVRKKVAERFIATHKLDWKFIVIYDDEIQLNNEQQRKYELLKKHTGAFGEILRFQQVDRKFNHTKMKYSKTVPLSKEFSTVEFIRLVKYGDTSIRIT